jgi:hypothetical protein
VEAQLFGGRLKFFPQLEERKTFRPTLRRKLAPSRDSLRGDLIGSRVKYHRLILNFQDQGRDFGALNRRYNGGGAPRGAAGRFAGRFWTIESARIWEVGMF